MQNTLLLVCSCNKYFFYGFLNEVDKESLLHCKLGEEHIVSFFEEGKLVKMRQVEFV